jgi:hypothetical protein
LFDEEIKKTSSLIMEVDEFNEDIDLNCMKVRKTRANSGLSNKG